MHGERPDDARRGTPLLCHEGRPAGRPRPWRFRPARLICLTAVLVLSVVCGAAAGTVYDRVLQAYQTSGTIAPCAFTSAELQQAQKGIDTYGAQYFTDFSAAISSALAARASGNCERGAGQALSRLGSIRGGSLNGNGKVRGPITAATGAGVPLPLLMAAALVLLAAGWGGVAALWHARGWNPRWARFTRHAVAEAAYRSGTVWLDIEDRVRRRRSA